MGAGEAAILNRELLRYYDAIAFAVDEPGRLDRHRVRSSGRSGGDVLGVVESDTEPLFDHGAKIQGKDLLRTGGRRRPDGGAPTPQVPQEFGRGGTSAGCNGSRQSILPRLGVYYMMGLSAKRTLHLDGLGVAERRGPRCWGSSTEGVAELSGWVHGRPGRRRPARLPLRSDAARQRGRGGPRRGEPDQPAAPPGTCPGDAARQDRRGPHLDRETGEFLWATRPSPETSSPTSRAPPARWTENPETVFRGFGAEVFTCPTAKGAGTGRRAPTARAPTPWTCRCATPARAWPPRRRRTLALQPEHAERAGRRARTSSVRSGPSRPRPSAVASTHEQRSATRSLAAIAGGVVCVGDVIGRVKALDDEAGDVLWGSVTYAVDGRQYVVAGTAPAATRRSGAR